MRTIIYSIIAHTINNVESLAKRRDSHVHRIENAAIIDRTLGQTAYRVHIGHLTPPTFDWNMNMVASVVAEMANDRDVRHMVEFDQSSLWLTIWE